MTALNTESRAQFLARLALLLEHGVRLQEALSAFARDPRADWAAAATRALPHATEGASLADVLGHAGLLDLSEEALLNASEGSAARPLGLLARELGAHAKLMGALHAAVARPVFKMGVVAVVAGLIATIQLSTMRMTLTVSGGAGLLLEDPALSSALTFVTATAAILTFIGGLRVILRRADVRRMLEASLRESVSLERLVLLENGARFLRTLGTALEAGLPLPRALRRAQESFAGRVVADEVEVLCDMASDGAPLGSCLSIAPFLDSTTRWTLERADQRPDLPAEMLALADALQADLIRELETMTPFLNGFANVVFAIPVLATAVAFFAGAGQFVGGMFGGL